MIECNLKEKERCALRILLTSLCIFLIVLIVSKAIDIQSKLTETENTITVSDTGEVYAKPDLALTTFSVITEAETVAEAMNENTEKMNAVIDFVKSQGAESKDIKTTSFNIYPRYEYRKVETEIYPYPPGKRVLVGYEIRQSLEVKIRDMHDIGSIIQGATDAGANQVGDLQFTIDKEDEFKKQARKEAIKKAKSVRVRSKNKDLGIMKINKFLKKCSR